MIATSNLFKSVWAGGIVAGVVGVSATMGIINTTLVDFFGPGTQPGGLLETIVSAQQCTLCHSGYGDEEHEPYVKWAASMMGQAARDPIFHAGLAIANQDAAFAGDLCLRCHTPGAWLEGRSLPTDGSALTGKDFEGVSCNVCHRMVDPVYAPGQSPPVDEQILADLTDPPASPHSAHYVIDPEDRRRGPFDLIEFFWHDWAQSPFHESASLCATCHDVSNPAFTRQPDGSYALNALDTPHPTDDKYDQFPIERTYSEWSASAFALGPIEMGGRFGGNKTAVSTCQDCHMPDGSGYAARPGLGAFFRDDLPVHNFSGANSWVLRAVRSLYPDDAATGLSALSVDKAILANERMLALASDMSLVADATDLTVRITNMSGHKLPTGYAEGRRMWLNVRFLDAAGGLIAERGAYDTGTATLTTADTKVYEAEQGLDAAVAAATGLPEGPSFHFAINNKIYFDNRIPPMGFTNAAFEAVQAQPVGYTYADGQNWDETTYPIPPGTDSVQVNLYHQTTTRQYIEFLRDENITNGAGQTAYDQWVLHGKSAPVLMLSQTLDLTPPCLADIDGDGDADVADFFAFILAFASGDPAADLNGDGSVDVGDFFVFIVGFAAGCA